jgi:hypothetical protein
LIHPSRPCGAGLPARVRQGGRRRARAGDITPQQADALEFIEARGIVGLRPRAGKLGGMKFRIEHVLQSIDLAAYERLYFDEPFQSALGEAVKIDRELLRLDRGPERIVRHVRVRPEREIPAPVAKLLGGKRLGYVDELEYEIGRYHGTWRIVPAGLAAKIAIGGTLDFAAVAGGVRRVLAGEIDVNLFGLGGLVEKLVVSNIEKSYDDAAAFTARWIAGGRSS